MLSPRWLFMGIKGMRSHLAAAWPCNMEGGMKSWVGTRLRWSLQGHSALVGVSVWGWIQLFLLGNYHRLCLTGGETEAGRSCPRQGCSGDVCGLAAAPEWGAFGGDKDSLSGQLDREPEIWGWLSLCQLLTAGNGHHQPRLHRPLSWPGTQAPHAAPAGCASVLPCPQWGQGGCSHMPLALAALESMGLGASWEGAAAPGIGRGQGHCPRRCWFPCQISSPPASHS